MPHTPPHVCPAHPWGGEVRRPRGRPWPAAARKAGVLPPAPLRGLHFPANPRGPGDQGMGRRWQGAVPSRAAGPGSPTRRRRSPCLSFLSCKAGNRTCRYRSRRRRGFSPGAGGETPILRCGFPTLPRAPRTTPSCSPGGRARGAWPGRGRRALAPGRRPAPCGRGFSPSGQATCEAPGTGRAGSESPGDSFLSLQRIRHPGGRHAHHLTTGSPGAGPRGRARPPPSLAQQTLHAPPPRPASA